MDYRQAGVDVAAGRDFVERIRTNVESTFRPEVMGTVGGFGGLFNLPSGYQEPVLVSGTDGVGTKLKLAQALQRHDTIGIDLVAMCVNDVLASGAEPLFFLDYLATGALDKTQLAEVVAGISAGCRESGCALLGGETAEMPGFYPAGTYDVAGFCVGIVEKAKILDGQKIQAGDRILGLASSGVHSNGFSLVRQIVEVGGFAWSDCPAELAGQTLGEVLLAPTQLYVKPVLGALKRSDFSIRGLAHITGGGLPENLPRSLPCGLQAQLDPQRWSTPPIFQWLGTAGNVPLPDLYETFNMGIGYTVILPTAQVSAVIAYFQDLGLDAYEIGEIVPGEKGVTGLIA
ncbi:MAG: phosphoribosylformylglycinamidine cyclo-ligase [Cyanobacteria bacterium P01_H01_bin.15]